MQLFLTQTFSLAVFYIRFALSSILQKMASEQLVTEQFQFLGIEVENEVLSKCKYLFVATSLVYAHVFTIWFALKVVVLLEPQNECSRLFLYWNLTTFQGVTLCEEYGVDAETFTEQWMAFSLTHLSGAAPTVENLDLLARKEFSKRAANRLNKPGNDAAHRSTGSSLTVYGAPVSTQYPFYYEWSTCSIVFYYFWNTPTKYIICRY